MKLAHISQRLKATAIACVAVISVGAVAHADAESTWAVEDVGNTRGNEFLYSTASDTETLAFFCTGGKLQSVIALDPQNMANVLEGLRNNSRSVGKFITLEIDDENISKQKWGLNKKMGVVITPKQSLTIKLYNAAVQGKTIKIKRRGEDTKTIYTPTTNAAFADFGGACGIGRNKA